MRLVLRLGPAVRREIEHLHLDAGAEVVGDGELLQIGRDDFGRDAVHLQHAGRNGLRVGRDKPQGMNRRNTAHGPRLLAQLLAESAEERFGVELLRGLRGGDFVFDAKTYLVHLPVLETRREELESQRSLLAQQFYGQAVLERMGDARFSGVERRASKDAFERLGNFHLHVASFLVEFAGKTPRQGPLLYGAGASRIRSGRMR